MEVEKDLVVFDDDTKKEIVQIVQISNELNMRLNYISRSYLRALGKDPNKYIFLQDFTGLIEK
jgi:hypothetical protein